MYANEDDFLLAGLRVISALACLSERIALEWKRVAHFSFVVFILRLRFVTYL